MNELSEREILLTNTKEDLVEMILKERLAASKVLANYIDLQKEISKELAALTSKTLHHSERKQ